LFTVIQQSLQILERIVIPKLNFNLIVHKYENFNPFN